MKFPDEPTNPYIRHSPHTLTDPNRASHGIGPRSGAASRTAGAMMRPLGRVDFAASAPDGCETRSKTERQPARPNRPRAKKEWSTSRTDRAIRETGRDSPRPPSRLNIQTNPWAEPRSVTGIQSAITRDQTGKNPA